MTTKVPTIFVSHTSPESEPAKVLNAQIVYAFDDAAKVFVSSGLFSGQQDSRKTNRTGENRFQAAVMK